MLHFAQEWQYQMRSYQEILLKIVFDKVCR